MSGAAARRSHSGAHPPPPTAAAAAAEGEEGRWEVEFARFFNFPRRSPSSYSSTTSSAALLRPLRKKKLRSGGTWIAAASAASLRLLGRRAASVAILSVSIGDDVIEEHFVSNLHFSWPQVSCDTQCPIRGSRVVLLSYRDISNEIQKFAVRFTTSSGAETFLNCVKECSRDAMDILQPGSDFVGDDSSESEYNVSSRLHYGYNEMSNIGEPVGIKEEREDLSRQPLLANNIETIFSNFPRSFAELLNNCSNDTGKGRLYPMVETELASYQEGYPTGSSTHGAEGQPKLMEEGDLKSSVERYLADSSFYEMLLKLDKVIDDLGGDLALK